MVPDRRSALRIIVGLAAIGALSLAAAPADAAKSKKKKSSLSKLKVGTSSLATATGFPSVASATATCPGSTEAVSGGFLVTLPPDLTPPGAHWLNIYESQRVGNNAWRASGIQDFGGMATDSLTTFVYCLNLKRDVETVTASVALSSTPNAAASVGATCPKGTKLFSGGFSVTPEGNFFGALVTGSSPTTKRSWQLDTSTIFGPGSGTATVNSYCYDLDKSKLRTGTGIVTGPSGTPTVTESAKAAKGTKARGGGFVVTPPGAAGLQGAVIIYGSKLADSGNRWADYSTMGGDAGTGRDDVILIMEGQFLKPSPNEKQKK